jgi:hypothetical protein
MKREAHRFLFFPGGGGVADLASVYLDFKTGTARNIAGCEVMGGVWFFRV